MINSIQTRQVMHIYLCNPALSGYVGNIKEDKKLSYRRGTARCVVSIKILPIATQQCRNYLYDKS